MRIKLGSWIICRESSWKYLVQEICDLQSGLHGNLGLAVRLGNDSNPGATK